MEQGTSYVQDGVVRWSKEELIEDFIDNFRRVFDETATGIERGVVANSHGSLH